jgi:alkylhydroperoxidase family enzyme
MQNLTIHTLDTAPEQSKPALQGLQKNFGFVPNAAATMAGSPVLINAFVSSFGSFHGSPFNDREKQTILLTNAVAFKCAWTTAFHSTLALKVGVSDTDVAAIRNGKSPADTKLAALSNLAKAFIERKGHGADREVEQLIAAGYNRDQLLEVIAGIAISTMAALTANVAGTPLEDMFKTQIWQAA